jgi:(p)ppGpp synthase/HD superfamily hydrolase
MDKLAEWGIAAYHSGRWVPDAMGSIAATRKSGNGAAAGHVTANPSGSSTCLDDADIARKVSWLKSIRDWQEEFVGNMSSREFVDTVTGDLLSSRVFVFTPKGEVKNLPKGATVIDYAYQIHTDVGNKMVAAKVNGNLVSPIHTLANAEVVEIVTYDGISNKKLFQLHRQWLEYAKTRSARHKLTKFLKEQAALSAEEITIDTINEFIGDGNGDECDDDPFSSLDSCATIYTTESTFLSTSNGSYKESSSSKRKTNGAVNGAVNGATNGAVYRAVNGATNGAVYRAVNGAGNGAGNGSSKSEVRSIQDEARASFDAWRADRIAVWHTSGGGSVQWFSVCCHDRNSILAEVTAILVAAGIRIRACAAETDSVKGLGIMIFQIEGSDDDLVESCASIESLGGMLEWSAGSSWLGHPVISPRLS